MRYNKYIGICFVSLALAMHSCKDPLEIENTQNLSDLAVWNSENAADMYVTASYKTFTDVSQVANSRNVFYDSYSDIMKSTSWDMYNHAYNKALLQSSAFASGSAGAFEVWNSVYSDRIRRANVLLDDIKRYGEPKFGPNWANIRSAEARFCRAFSYYRLIRVYGGIVLRTDNSGTSGGVDDGYFEQDIHRARLSEEESWDFVIAELSWAAEHLPETWADSWKGRATKRSAYALLSRIALHAKKWDIAINAADKLSTLGASLAADYGKVFQVGSNQNNDSEVLFALYYQSGTLTHSFDRYNRPFGDRMVYNSDVYAEHVPTGDLADMYEFKNGTDFSWSTYMNTESNPYTNREPRFHATILFNGSSWEGRTIQSYVGGTDGFIAFEKSASTAGHTCTGYYLRKFLQEGNSDFITKGSYQYDPMLRYAEVLLNKAEAYAELDYNQHADKALEALNQVRRRVNLPAKTKSQAPSKDAFMALLRKERTVELAGEGLRYWDLRRWRLAESVINGKQASGVRITRSNTNTYTYEKVNIDGGSARVFLEKYYYFSLPTSETSNNKLVENNLFW